MSFPSDRTSVGFIPFQDHERGIALHAKQGWAGARVARVDPDGTVRWAVDEFGQPTLGDLTGWGHWPGASRPSGSWSPVFAGIGTEGLHSSPEGQALGAGGGGAGSGGAVAGGASGAGDADAGKGKAPGASPTDSPGFARPPGQGPLNGGGPVWAGGGLAGDYYGDAVLKYDPGTGTYRGGVAGVRNDPFPQPRFGIPGARPGLRPGQGGSFFGFESDGRGGVKTHGLSPGPGGKVLKFFVGRHSAASFLGGVNVYVTKNNQSLFKNKRKKAGPDGKVLAWVGKKDGSNGVGNSRGGVGNPNITPGGDEPNVFVGNPIGQDSYLPDVSFRSRAYALPDFVPAYPLNTMFIGLTATIHERQDNLAMWADPRIACFSAHGDGAMSSWFVDGTDRDTFDCRGPDPTADGRAAPTHSMFRVVRLATEMGDNGIAWQLTTGGDDDRSGYGLVYGRTVEYDTEGKLWHFDDIDDIKEQDAANRRRAARGGKEEFFYPTFDVYRSKGAPSGLACAVMAAEAGGPLSLGSMQDKHAHPTTKDGEPCNIGHIQTEACFFRNYEQDAPLDFSTMPFPKKLTPGSRFVECFISYDPDAKHKCLGEDMDGLWRIWARVPFTKSGGGGGGLTPPPSSGTPPVTRPPIDIAPDPPVRRAPPISPGTGPGVPDPPTPPPQPPKNPPSTTPGSGDGGGGGGSGGPGSYGPFPGPFPPHPSLLPIPPQKRRFRVAPPDHSNGPADSHIMWDVSVGFTSQVFRPQSTNSGQIDYRYTDYPPPLEQEREDARRPMVLKAEAWGKEQNGEWGYTVGMERGTLPTANGGIAFINPELEMMDYAKDFAPTSVSKSTSYVAATPGVYFAAGTPVPATGGLKSGVRWGVDSSGHLQFTGLSSAEVATNALKILSSGAVQHQSTLLGFFGVTPATRAAAYTQTYATADRTHANLTVGSDIGAFTDPPSAVEMEALRTFVNALKADLVDVKQFVNAIADDLQSYGLGQ